MSKRDSITAEIYKELIRTAEGPTYLNIRLRIAFCILVITGRRINELQSILKIRFHFCLSCKLIRLRKTEANLSIRIALKGPLNAR